ncbi:ketopantoate reductase family protein [Streptomyces sp. G5(2025)]|uniref:ketopantoate reductase family protein n=1 Tax=Streptomyces sp. G5(2025) TaxID=3406628 RepID=UPI003C2544A2
MFWFQRGNALRHAILGAGGVGLALGASLAKSGLPVVLVMTESSYSRYPGRITVHSKLRESYSVPVRAVERLTEPIDVLWVATKAPALDSALERIHLAGEAPSIVPLLNGIGHLGPLRARFGPSLLPGSIRIEAMRTAPGEVTWNSLFASVDLASEDVTNASRLRSLRAELEQAGFGCQFGDSAEAVLWHKLIFLLPLALATTAAKGPVGVVRRNPELLALMRDVCRELCAVAASQGIAVDAAASQRLLDSFPGRTDSSMHRDAAEGRPTELDALTEPVLRLGAAGGIPTPSIRELAQYARDAGS